MTAANQPSVSIVIASRQRPVELARAISSLRLQRYRNFEVLVVGDTPELSADGLDPSLANLVLYGHCAEANISRARNVGLAKASGELVAFLDDDAVPEADWLEELVIPFERPEVGAVGGFVRSHTGVGFQWTLEAFDRNADPVRLSRPSHDEPVYFPPKPDSFPQTFGVNCAFRREALTGIGGFDENFHYYLDETDVNLRLSEAGWTTAVAPRAEVHHFFAPSDHRAEDRTPKSLFQIGASKAYFCAKHGAGDASGALDRFVQTHRDRLQILVDRDRLSEKRVGQLIEGLQAGFEEGGRRSQAAERPDFAATAARISPFDALLPADRPHVAVGGLNIGIEALRGLARKLAVSGCESTLISPHLSTRPLRVRFEEGIWRHDAGLFCRRARLARAFTCSRLVAMELDRVGGRRDFGVLVCPSGDESRYGAKVVAKVGGAFGKYVIAALNVGQLGEAKRVADICA